MDAITKAQKWQLMTQWQNLKVKAIVGSVAPPERMFQKNVIETEDNLLKSLLKNQTKDKILFPYNFKWVLLSCAYSVSLITQGYIHVTHELCMRAQLPLYSPSD